MGITEEKDMDVREIKPDFKYWDKVFAKYPILGNVIVSDSNASKINSKAKEALDKLVESPSLSSTVPIFWHQLITLATLNYAKKWDVSEESKFTKYITLQFGYRNDSGKIWGIIASSLEKALGTKRRFFLKDKGGREFYETVLVHSFAPMNSWNSVFDILYDFLKNNLRWNYIKGDPIIINMVSALNSKLNGNTSDDEDLIISSMEYKVRLGAKRLLQNRPLYTAELFDDILNRINDLVQNQATEPKYYIDQLIDSWFTNKINRMIEGERRQLVRTTRTRIDTALSYSKIRASVYMEMGRLYIHIPAIRLEMTGHKLAEIKIYESGKIVGRSVPEIYGNELGETVSECKIPISLSADSKCDLCVQILCDGNVIYDSKQSLYRKLYCFKNGKETSINSLRSGEYEIYVPEKSKIIFKNIDVIEESGKYFKVFLKENFSISYMNRIIAMDISNIQEAAITEPAILKGCSYEYDGNIFEIVETSDYFKLYFDKNKTSQSAKLFCNDVEINLEEYLNNDAISTGVCEVPVSKLGKHESLVEVVFLNLEDNAILYKKCFLLVDRLQISFNREFYVKQEEFQDAKLHLTVDEDEQVIQITPEDFIIDYEYANGEIHIVLPVIKYSWKNIENIYAGNNIWKGDLASDSSLEISCADDISFGVEIGGWRYRQFDINLFNIVQKEGSSARFNYPIVLVVRDKRYKLGQIIFSEMFSSSPIFSSDSDAIYWDGGINYIGEKEESLELQLIRNEEISYTFDLLFDECRINLPRDFEDGEYTYQIVKARENDELVLAQDIQFFGNPNKLRFKDKTIQISEVTEDVGEGSRPLQIKSVYIEKIEFIAREFVPSEDGVFDIYEGQMYFIRPDGTKKYYSRKYAEYGSASYYKVNPVRIIYINDKLLRIVNEDEEGLYCYDNFGTTPRLEITDREPGRAAKSYKDILFYVYGTKSKTKKPTIASSIINQTYSNQISVFDKFEYVPQTEVVEAEASRRILVNAGPGTGKTWTLIERIINLVDIQGIDPETILVLCFSKAAVEVIKSRLKTAVDENRVSEIVNQVDVRTFDSFASQVLYWVKNESEYDNLQYHDIGKLDYESRIKLFVSLIRDLPELIEQCTHLIVDEVQDLVKERARMVLEMIRSIPKEAGVTLLGDSCQSIYDYQTGNDNMSSAQFYRVMCERMNGFSFYSFNRNFRQGEDLAEIGDSYRKCILSGNSKNCDAHWNNSIANAIQRFDEYDAMKITDYLLHRLYEKGTVGILTRTNGQALKISASLREKGIEHVLRRRLSDNSLAKWIALIFNEYDVSSINEEEFVERYNSLGIKEQIAEETWQALRDAAKTSSERIGIREILRGIISNARNPILFSVEPDSVLTVTNIHRGKGREFDTVLIEDDIFGTEEKPIDEHKVCYVALTRPKKEIFRIDAKADYMRIDKEGDRRCFKAEFVGFKKQRLTFFEVGVGNDLDLRSFVRVAGAQEYIRNNHDTIIGMKIVLSKDRRESEYVKYNIVLDETGTVLGSTSREFAESLSRALRIVYNLPKNKSVYINVYPERFTDIYVDDVISVVDQADGSEMGVKTHGEMVTWNAVSIVGYSRIEYI